MSGADNTRKHINGDAVRDNPAGGKPKTPPVYAVHDLDFTYPGTDRQILKKVTFDLYPGEIMEILGPNGAGKTTLLSLMMGFLKADGGMITLGDQRLDTLKAKEIARIAAYVPQTHEPSFDYRVRDFIIMGAAPGKGMFERPSREDEERCASIMEEMGIAHLADRSYMRISGGERQQALIARAVMQEPQVILFDEPTAHLDYGNSYRTLEMVKAMAEKGFAVVITTHDPNQALLLGGKAGILDAGGRMTCGPVEEIITEERLEEIYGCALRLVRIEEMDRTACITPKL